MSWVGIGEVLSPVVAAAVVVVEVEEHPWMMDLKIRNWTRMDPVEVDC